MQQNMSPISRPCDVLGSAILKPLNSGVEGTSTIKKIMMFGDIKLHFF
jgi:hypothetical protein